MKIYESTELSNEQYHGDRTHISSSIVKNAFKGKEYFEQQIAEMGKPTSAMLFGTYIHTLILEPSLVEREFAIFDGARRSGKAWDGFQRDNKGKIILLRSDAEMAKILIENYSSCKAATDLISKGRPEVSFFSELNGVKVKVRTDWLRDDGHIADIKTTSGGLTDFEIAQTIKKYGYHISAAMYLEVVAHFTKKPGKFYFVFLSKKDGKTRCFEASEQMIKKGREYLYQGLENIKGFYSSDSFTDYKTTITPISLPEQMFYEGVC